MVRKARPSCLDILLYRCFIWIKSEIKYAWAISSIRISVDNLGTSNTSSKEARMSDGIIP